MATITIGVKRAYDPVSPADGTRFLVDVCGRAASRNQKLRTAAWLKEVGPSTELRQWFSHDPVKWDEFPKTVSARTRLQTGGVAADRVSRAPRAGHACL
jgi:uncharacterized protein YeaO (DUF488 family)